jgi:transcriptional regulator with XRE-family HTH domain
MNGLGQRIKEVRRKRGLSQKAFAEVLGVSGSHVSTIETGAAAPSKQLIKAICREYGVREEWLVEGKSILSEEDGLSSEQIADLESNLEAVSKKGIYRVLDAYSEIILQMSESLWEYSFCYREIGVPDEKLLAIKDELEDMLASLRRDLDWFFDKLKEQKPHKFISPDELREMARKAMKSSREQGDGEEGKSEEEDL